MADGRDRVRAGQPRPGGRPAGGPQARRGGRHRPLRPAQPDQQRARLPRRVPRHARRRTPRSSPRRWRSRRPGPSPTRSARTRSTRRSSCRASSTRGSPRPWPPRSAPPRTAPAPLPAADRRLLAVARVEATPAATAWRHRRLRADPASSKDSRQASWPDAGRDRPGRRRRAARSISPVATSTAGPASQQVAPSTVTVSRPPGTSTAPSPVVAAGVAQRDRGHRARAGAAGQRLAGPALVHPHRARAGRRRHRSPATTNSTLTPAGKTAGSKPGARGQVERRPASTRGRADQVRVAAVDRRAGQGQRRRARRPRCRVHRGTAHVDGDRRRPTTARAPRRPGWPGRASRPGVARPGVEQVAGEDPHPVAAHLGERAVGVPVVHEPLGLAGACRPRRDASPTRTTRSTPSAPMPRRRSHSAATSAGRQRRARRRGRAGSRSRCRCRGPWRTARRPSCRDRRRTSARAADQIGPARAVQPDDPRVAAEPGPLPADEPPGRPDRLVARLRLGAARRPGRRSTCW